MHFCVRPQLLVTLGLQVAGVCAGMGLVSSGIVSTSFLAKLLVPGVDLITNVMPSVCIADTDLAIDAC